MSKTKDFNTLSFSSVPSVPSVVVKKRWSQFAAGFKRTDKGEV